MSHCTPRNPSGYNGRTTSLENSPFERAARHVERRTGIRRDQWMRGLARNVLNDRHYRLMCRLAGIRKVRIAEDGSALTNTPTQAAA